MSQIYDSNGEMSADDTLRTMHEWTGAAYRSLWEWARKNSSNDDEAWERFGWLMQEQLLKRELIMKGVATILDGQLVLFGEEGVPA